MNASDSTTDRAAQLREAFKARGWKRNKISVRTDYYSLGSSIRVVIKDCDIPLREVKQEAEKHERIHRDEATGEILGGGNRYVDVSYDSAAAFQLAKKWEPQVQAALAQLAPDSQQHASIEGTEYTVGNANFGRFSLWSRDAHVCERNDANGLAFELAIAMQRAESRAAS